MYEAFVGLFGGGYEWFKALHVIFVISWMAGLLYLPRLYVYHCTAEPGSAQSETFKVMERRLLRVIMTPAAVLSYLFGLWMLFLIPDWLLEPWMILKLFAVAGMTWMHWLLASWREDFAADRNTRPQRFYRIVNEVPTLLMIAIVILVIVKPF